MDVLERCEQGTHDNQHCFILFQLPTSALQRVKKIHHWWANP
jgi:hypothetical protein